jgi:hypothetical protein
MANKPTHTLSMVTKYKTSTGEEKNRFTQVAAGWENDNGSLFFEIPRGMLVSGTLCSSPVRERESTGQAKEVGVEDPNNDLPF